MRRASAAPWLRVEPEWEETILRWMPITLYEDAKFMTQHLLVTFATECFGWFHDHRSELDTALADLAISPSMLVALHRDSRGQQQPGEQGLPEEP